MKRPHFETVTYRARKKKRFALIADGTLIALMKNVGHRLREAPRCPDADPSRLVGIYALPSNNVLEVYRSAAGGEIGYLFTSLDVWMSFTTGVDYA